jgi:phosphatidylglycerophosphate synthase
METIEDLRKICQKTRVTVFKDFLSYFYQFISIYFTKFFLIIRLSGNQVTILSGIVSIIGGFLISFDNKIITLIGFSCFHLFAIFDYCDGEVARYNKKGGVEGHFLDWFMHFVTSSALMIGLFIYSFKTIDNYFILVFALLAIMIPIFDKIITSAGWTVIAWTKLRRFNNQNPIKINKDLTKRNNPIKKNRLTQIIKLILLHLLTEHWIKFTLIIISLIDLIFFFIGYNFFNYKFYILIYIGITGPAYIFLRIFKLLRSRSLVHGYNRLFIPKEKPIFPNDDFL